LTRLFSFMSDDVVREHCYPLNLGHGEKNGGTVFCMRPYHCAVPVRSMLTSIAACSPSPLSRPSNELRASTSSKSHVSSRSSVTGKSTCNIDPRKLRWTVTAVHVLRPFIRESRIRHSRSFTFCVDRYYRNSKMTVTVVRFGIVESSAIQ
jgi:hypothetical protein